MRACSRALIISLLAVNGFGQPSMELRILAAHNAVRTPLKLHPLTWSDKLAARAQDWADALLSQDKFYHRPKPESAQNSGTFRGPQPAAVGENLFARRGGAASPEDVVEAWAVESEDYDYRSNTCRKVCGHYTQMVWRDTKRVGCAVARNPRREVWVCNYEPAGNYVGDRPY